MTTDSRSVMVEGIDRKNYPQIRAFLPSRSMRSVLCGLLPGLGLDKAPPREPVDELRSFSKARESLQIRRGELGGPSPPKEGMLAF
jgi:hypothetical protein